jgi:hypothetical protein
MRAMRIHLRDLPTRLATGAYVLHTGLEKWHGTEDQAKGVQGVAAGADAGRSEPSRRGGTVGFLRRARGDVPANASYAQAEQRVATPAGIAVSKDVWMLGIGIGLIADRDAGVFV